jgi:hypothetical protein
MGAITAMIGIIDIAIIATGITTTTMTGIAVTIGIETVGTTVITGARER